LADSVNITFGPKLGFKTYISGLGGFRDSGRVRTSERSQFTALLHNMFPQSAWVYRFQVDCVVTADCVTRLWLFRCQKTQSRVPDNVNLVHNWIGM